MGSVHCVIIKKMSKTNSGVHSSSVLSVNNLPVSLQIPLKLFADHPELRPWRARLVYSAGIITTHHFKRGLDNFSNECRYNKPKYLLCPITKDWKQPVGPIKTRITCSARKSRLVLVFILIGWESSESFSSQKFFKPHTIWFIVDLSSVFYFFSEVFLFTLSALQFWHRLISNSTPKQER